MSQLQRDLYAALQLFALFYISISTWGFHLHLHFNIYNINIFFADKSHKSPMPTVTPIQGPIFLKNGSVPVVPLFSYPKSNNGSFLQIPVSDK